MIADACKVVDASLTPEQRKRRQDAWVDFVMASFAPSDVGETK